MNTMMVGTYAAVRKMGHQVAVQHVVLRLLVPLKTTCCGRAAHQHEDIVTEVLL